MRRMVADHSEAELREWLRVLCKRTGAKLYFTARSDRSPAGWPDVQIVRGSRLYVAELKRDRGPKGGRGGGTPLTAAQRGWLDALAGVDRVHVALWRPADLERIGAALTVNETPPGLWVPGRGRLDEVVD
jgi:hypothetical protein